MAEEEPDSKDDDPLCDVLGGFHIYNDTAEEESDDIDRHERKVKALLLRRPEPKPKWWRKQAGRRATKGQQRAINEMQASHMLAHVPYGEFVDWAALFPRANERWLEIGFGQGENLLANAERHWQIGIVGADLHRPAVGTALQRIQQSIADNQFWSDYTLYDPNKDPYAKSNCEEIFTKPISLPSPPVPQEQLTPYSNVRIYNGDGMKLLYAIPTGSLSRILLTFPDPFPGTANAKFRALQVATLGDIYRVLDKGTGRFYLATDHHEYFDWCNTLMDQCSNMFRRISPCPDRMDWLPAISKYESKGWDEGRQTSLSCWEAHPEQDKRNIPE